MLTVFLSMSLTTTRTCFKFEDGASNLNAHAAPRTDEHDGDIDISQVAGGDIASTM